MTVDTKFLRKKIARAALRSVFFAFGLIMLTACQIELNANLEEQEANEMMASLLSAGIATTKVLEKDSVTLMVDQTQFGQAVEVLKQSGLPRKKFVNTGDLFSTEGLVASPVQEWARLNYAKSQELSNSISSIPGVVNVDVHIANSRRENPFDEPKPPSASVLIVMRQDQITDDLIPQIKQLITFSVPDISYDRVGVVISPLQAALPTAALVSFAGLIVHEDSAMAVKALAFGGGIGTLAFVTLGGLMFVQRRSARPTTGRQK